MSLLFVDIAQNERVKNYCSTHEQDIGHRYTDTSVNVLYLSNGLARYENLFAHTFAVIRLHLSKKELYIA